MYYILDNVWMHILLAILSCFSGIIFPASTLPWLQTCATFHSKVTLTEFCLLVKHYFLKNCLISHPFECQTLKVVPPQIIHIQIAFKAFWHLMQEWSCKPGLPTNHLIYTLAPSQGNSFKAKLKFFTFCYFSRGPENTVSWLHSDIHPVSCPPYNSCYVVLGTDAVVMYGCESWIIKKSERQLLLNCGAGEDSWESLGLQGDQTCQS